MPRYRALRGFSYLADETEHLAAVAGELAYEAGHRTRIEAGQIVENLPQWVVAALTFRGHIEDAEAPSQPVNEPPAPTPEPQPAPVEPEAPAVVAPEPVIDYTTEPAATDLGEPAPPEVTP